MRLLLHIFSFLNLNGLCQGVNVEQSADTHKAFCKSLNGTLTTFDKLLLLLKQCFSCFSCKFSVLIQDGNGARSPGVIAALATYINNILSSLGVEFMQRNVSD